jgi:hypothetical protein
VQEEEAGESFDACFTGKGPTELGAEVAEGGGAVERHDAGGGEDRCLARDIELVFQFADDLFEGIFGGDDADG